MKLVLEGEKIKGHAERIPWDTGWQWVIWPYPHLRAARTKIRALCSGIRVPGFRLPRSRHTNGLMCKDAARQAGQENHVKLRNGPVPFPPPHNLTKSNPAQHNPNHYPFGNLMMSADCCGRATQNGSDSFTRCTRVSTGSRRRKSGTPRTFPSYFCAQMTAKCNNEKLFLCQIDEYEIFHKKKKKKKIK